MCCNDCYPHQLPSSVWEPQELVPSSSERILAVFKNIFVPGLIRYSTHTFPKRDLPGISHFSKEPSFLLVETEFRNQNLSTQKSIKQIGVCISSFREELTTQHELNGSKGFV